MPRKRKANTTKNTEILLERDKEKRVKIENHSYTAEKT